MAQEIGRRGDQQQGVGLAAGQIDVVGEGYAVGVEGDVAEIDGVVAQTAEVVDAVAAAHIPNDGASVGHQQL